jgi:hypothetical protein
MPLNDKAVVTAAQGFVFVGSVGTAAPTPAELDTIDPALYGAKVVTLTVTGAPTSLKLTVDSVSTGVLPIAATAAQVQAALETLSTVGAGNVSVTGTNFTSGLAVAFIGSLQGQSITITADTFVGGTAPALVTTVTTPLNGWGNIGHTSRDDMPEFGFDGGDTEVKGTWQNEALREVVTKTEADFVTLTLEQFDSTSLELYFGEKAESSPDGVFGVAGGAQSPTERALLIIIRDGTTNLGFYAPKASIRKDDSINLPVDDFAGLPIKATFLKNGISRLYDWISLDLFS